MDRRDDADVEIRAATPADEAALGRYGAALMRQHHAADPRRFLMTAHPEAGYGRFLVSQVAEPDCLVQVAVRSGAIVGYVYASLEPVSWRDLRGPCGYLHDVYVDAGARGAGIGGRLVRAALDWVRAHGSTQVVLSSATGNETAQRLFAGLGFRPTMVEMTLDLGPGDQVTTREAT